MMNSAIAVAVASTGGLLVLDSIEGVALAVKDGGWGAISLQKLPGVAEKAVAPLIVGLGGSVVAAAMSGIPSTSVTDVVTGLVGILGLRALADVKSKAAQLFGLTPPKAA